jgi:putative nucleotidyltransferase with HDIG domain
VQSSTATLSLRPRSPSEILKSASELPFLPPSFELVPRLLLLLEDPEVNGENLADVIRVDAGLTADVLHVSNTVNFGANHRVETLQEAIMRLGLRQIYGTVMKVIASPVLASAQQTGFARLDLWRHSVACALAAKALALETGTSDPEVAFTAGLLHDVGKVVLCQALGADYIALVEECRLSGASFHEAEQRAFQVGHSDVGARLLQRWKFPESIVAAVAAHHNPIIAANRHKPLAAVTHVANALAHRTNPREICPPYAAQPEPACLQLIGLPVAALEGYEEQLLELTEQEQRQWR